MLYFGLESGKIKISEIESGIKRFLRNVAKANSFIHLQFRRQYRLTKR